MRRDSRRFVLGTLAVALFWSATAAAAEDGKKVTLLFTGDNGGEVAPCG
jgi:hypothetical protein